MAGNVRRTIRWLMKPLLARTRPKELALGLTIGLVVGLLPKDNLLAVGLAISTLFLPAHLGLSLLGCFVGCFLGGPLDSVTDPIGRSMLQNQAMQSTWVWIYNQPVLPWLNLHNSVVLGSVALLAPISPIVYVATATVFRFVHRLVEQYRVDSIVGQTRKYKNVMRVLHRDRKQASLAAGPQTEPTDLELYESKLLEESLALAEEAQREAQPDTELSKELRNNGGLVRIDEHQHRSIPPVKRVDFDFSKQQPSSEIEATSIDHGQIQPQATSPAEQLAWLAGVRIDPGQEMPGNLGSNQVPAGTDTTVRASNTANHHFAIGDTLQETLIEVVRFKPSQGLGPGSPAMKSSVQEKSSLSTDSSGSPRSSLAVPSPGASGSPSEESVPVSMSIKEAPVSMTIHTSPAPLPKPVVSNPEPTVMPTDGAAPANHDAPPVQPAEESLRYLLWHLSSLNRESKR